MNRGSRHGIDRREYLSRMREFAARGSALPQSRLNPELVREIRATRGKRTAKSWAQELGTHQRTIDKVRDYGSWVHVR